MTATLISAHELNNGLTLRFMDASKKIAADRWYVCIWVTISIPVDQKWFAQGSLEDDQFERITRILGPEVVFRQKKERNFVSDESKTQVVQQLCEQTIATGSGYLGSHTFAEKYIRKVYAERQGQQPT